MTALLTGNLPLLAGAPNGIKKLRELILELAVRGKLVAQDPNDEPAIELLKRIAEEKARLVVEGKIKKQKPQTDRDAEDQAFDLPTGWAWTRLSDVVNVLNGRAYKKEELLDAGTPVLRVGNLFTSNHWYYSTLTLEEDKYCNPGDLLFAWSASFGPFIWHGERSIYHYHIWKLDFYAKGQLNKHYLYNFLLEQTQEIKASGHGVSMVHMTKEKMEKLVVPLPPLAEQHRIVDKVDELMALCDRLEAQQASAESARDQLVQALLDSLTQARDASEFATNWQRLAEHFHTLFTTAPSIDALKQTLLQLAVMGKLVPQNPNDELASELLKRIAEEKARLVDEGKIKKQKPLPKLGEEEKPYALPKGWEWCRINDLVSIKHGYAFSSSYFSESVCPFILTTPGHFFKTGGFRERGNRTKYYCGPVAQEFILDPSDLIVAMTEQTAGLLGSAAFVPKDGKTYLHNQRLGKLIFNRELLSPEYLFHYFNGPFLRACIADSSTGMKVKHTSPEKIGLILFPLPSLAEQHRIVAKLDQLMALCDQLKPRLTQASQLSQQLASPLIERALAEDGQQTLVATDQKTARTLLAAEITYRLHAQRTFGQRKLQKVIYLAEHAARLAAIQGNYLRNVAGPHDRQLMDQVESELQNHQWYECIEREAFGHAYRPLSQAGRHHPAYESVWGTAERAIIEQVIELMRNWDTDRCEMTVTLYAVWNDFILEGRPVSDDSIVEEVMHSWNDTKLRFDKTKWSAILAEMKKHKILTPSGFGRRTSGGMLSLPGFD